MARETGWALPAGTKLQHYFTATGASLCRSWLLSASFEDVSDEPMQYLAACKRCTKKRAATPKEPSRG